ncbi:MAG TPA: dual specificity protein phosphatase [Gemmataceae bacterium]|nr:dual specificity protein phosphatase [Gemmataceae bacterium]
MDWITETIAIGNYLDAQDAELLRREAIGSVLGLTRALEGVEAAALGVQGIRMVPLADGPGNDLRTFRLALAALAELLASAPPVLVHCHAGRSRAAVVVAGHLIATRGLAPDEALALIAAKREIAVSPALERLLDHL